jgi:sigma-54 dependent transcriptional regulator, acetoin dehydrogenase operon transcriptional activator AcoR
MRPHDGETPGDDASDAQGAEPRACSATSEQVRPLREVELEHVRFALHVCNGNKSQAAQALGISRDTLYRKIAEFNLASSVEAGSVEPTRGPSG